MSRIQKYKESLYRFIKDKSCLFDNEEEEELNSYIYKKIKESDLIFSIMLLTVMNNQNKKNHVTMQGYYFAASVEFFNSIIYLIENKKEIVALFGDDKYFKLYNNLYLSINKSFQQNIESIKNPYQIKNDALVNVIIAALNVYNKTFKLVNKFTDFEFTILNRGCSNNIIIWYLKEDTKKIDKFRKLKRVSKESMNLYIEKKYLTTCELGIIIGWIMGGGDIQSIPNIKKTAKYVATMYKISRDFEKLDYDLENSENYTSNYVLNFGLQEAYELFLQNKEKFIEESMDYKIYTTTIKEVIDSIESNIDHIIDQSSPDLKSNYSSYSTK